MSEYRKKIQRAVLKVERKTRFKPPEGWFQKPRRTVNGKLRQAILDIFPFSMSEKQADVILHTMFDKMADALQSGESVVMPGVGRLYVVVRKARMRPKFTGVPGQQGKLIRIGSHKQKDTLYVTFRPARNVKTAINQLAPETDGNH